MKRLEIAGQKFWILKAVGAVFKDEHGRILWKFSCECGGYKIAIPNDVRNGRVKSCGCMAKENARRMGKANKGKTNRLTHGKSKTAEYRAWTAMKDRCYNKKNPGYINYGWRGIKICDVWINDFEQFYKDMGPRPSKNHSIDRILNGGSYNPRNCRWATRTTQNRNTRKVIYVEHNGLKKCLSEWAEYFGIHSSSLSQMAKKEGYLGAVEYYWKKYI